MELNKEKPIFIGGSKRGGTTLLRKIINAHSKITIPPPGWFYHFIYPHLSGYGDLKQEKNILNLIDDFLEIPLVKRYWAINEKPKEILSILPERSFRGVLFTFFDLYRKKSKKPMWGSKSPSNVFWFREIQNDFPEAKFLMLYRDGRDVSLDLLETYWGPSNLYNSCLLWKSYTTAMLESKKYLKDNSYHEIYYENLVNNSQDVLQGICNFLNIDYEESMLRFYEQDVDDFMKKSYHQKTKKPITNKYVGIYKKLSVDEKELQAAVIGDVLQKLGYKDIDKPRKIDFFERERYIEEDRHGGLITEGGVEYKLRLMKERPKQKR